MRSPRPSNPELILDARLAFDVRRKIRPLFAEISDTMIAFRREVVGQIENAAGRIRQIGLGGMRCKAVEQQQVALLGLNLYELEPGHLGSGKQPPFLTDQACEAGRVGHLETTVLDCRTVDGDER